MSKNRIKFNICGCEIVIGSEDSENYIHSIADEVEKAMEDIMGKNERVSITMAAILAALSYCDESHKASGGADHLRSQIKDYLEDSSRARMEAEESRREIERMKREIQTLRTRLSENGEGEAGEEALPARPIAPTPPVQRPQTGSFSRVQPDRAAEQEGFMSFFEKKTDD